MNNFSIEEIKAQMLEFLPRIMGAIVILLLGWLIIKLVLRILTRCLGRSKHIDPTIHPFLITLTRIGLLVLLALVCLSTLNIPVAPLITALGAVGLAVSLAIKDSLANLLGGSLLLISKPFTVGDYCSINGEEGTIAEIDFVYTALNTVDNKKIYIPNGQVVTATVINYNQEAMRRLELKFSIAYDADFRLAQKAVMEVVRANPRALRDPEPMVRMSGHGDSAVQLTCRVWVRPDDYWELNWDLWEGVKEEFDRLGISIPYSQLDVHVKKD